MKSRRVILLIAVSPVGCLLLVGRVASKELELKQVLIIYLLRLTDKLTLNWVSKRYGTCSCRGVTVKIGVRVKIQYSI